MNSEQKLSLFQGKNHVPKTSDSSPQLEKNQIERLISDVAKTDDRHPAKKPH